MPPIRRQDLPETVEATSFCRDELSQILIETMDSILEIASVSVVDVLNTSPQRLIRMLTVLTRVVERFGTQEEHKRACEILSSIERAF